MLRVLVLFCQLFTRTRVSGLEYIPSHTKDDLAVVDVRAEGNFRVAGADLGRHLLR